MTVTITTRPRTLESYLGGQWVKGSGTGQTLLDAATGAPVARIDSTGADFAGALDYGREVGRKLRGLSFHERALMLKALGQFLVAHKEEFYAESFATGATRADGWIDIEGGAGTLLSYASKARRELPNTRVLTDGEVEVLSKNNSFSAQHILTPLEGVAIHINAFNFPVWGMLEKVAPTFIAGVPSLVKPASQTWDGIVPVVHPEAFVQVSDYIGAAALLGSLPAAEWMIADRGYDADWFREALQNKGIRPCIPGRKSRGKPVKYDKRRYKRRNRIEIMFGRLKDWRRVATRYDRCAKTFLSAVALAATVMFWL